MNNPRRFVIAVLLGAAALWAQTPAKSTAPVKKDPEATAPGAAKSLPGFSVANMDRSADPCVDFYQYACGAWVKNNPIPADQSSWGRFDELLERNQNILRGILEKSAAEDSKRDPLEQQIGDFYASCMDEQTVNRKGLEPIQPELARIAAIGNKTAITEELARLQRMNISALFDFGAGPDFKNAKLNIAQVVQGGMGLPDRDYYLKEDERSVELRKKYEAHVQKMFQLLGDSPEKAVAGARAVMAIETGLAKGSLGQVDLRDPQKVYHKMTVQELVSLAPFMDWNKFFTGVGAPALDSLNVQSPAFFRQVESLVVQTSLEDLKTYMKWRVAHATAPLLTSALVNENFDFFRRTLTGAKEMLPRWKRCVELVDMDLGEALGRKYVDATFGAEGKQHTLKMVEEIEKALREDIAHLDWMTPETKKAALVKLEAITNKIGYPDKWRDYSSVKIARNDLLGNDWRATGFEIARQVNKIGKPVDPKEWGMTPPTVNAYYNPLMNNINFPAGILQPPFYEKQLDDPPNYGGIGAVVGHELTHGFDDQGRQFDPQGNLRDWWTKADADEFLKRADCFVKEYGNFVAVEDVHLNGKLTLGENTADNGGVRLAFMAMMESLQGKPRNKVEGLTPEQRLFLGWGQVWCENVRDETARLLAQVNPHSPGRARVNGVMTNMPEFQQAFACKLGQPMAPEPACRVW